MFPLLALLFAFHILKNKKQTSKKNLAREFFPKLPAVSQTLLQRCSDSSHWGAHLCVPLPQAGLQWGPYIGLAQRSVQRFPGVVMEPVGEGLACGIPQHQAPSSHLRDAETRHGLKCKLHVILFRNQIPEMLALHLFVFFQTHRWYPAQPYLEVRSLCQSLCLCLVLWRDSERTLVGV